MAGGKESRQAVSTVSRVALVSDETALQIAFLRCHIFKGLVIGNRSP
jgi:hypothetical protein